MRICAVKAGAYPDLACLWEASVRATHDFLAAEDVLALRQEVESIYLPALDLRTCQDDQGQYLGFIGVAAQRLEMLFVAPDCRRQGVGRFLLHHTIHEMGVSVVDVNEQNPQALAFYQRLGFVMYGRSSLDNQGRPYPLLHLHLAAAVS